MSDHHASGAHHTPPTARPVPLHLSQGFPDYYVLTAAPPKRLASNAGSCFITLPDLVDIDSEAMVQQQDDLACVKRHRQGPGLGGGVGAGSAASATDMADVVRQIKHHLTAIRAQRKVWPGSGAGLHEVQAGHKIPALMELGRSLWFLSHFV